MATIIFGPTCSGKSVYINKLQEAGNTQDIVFGFELQENGFKRGDLVHYNLLHHRVAKGPNQMPLRRLGHEPIFQDILAASEKVERAVVLVSPVKALIKRAKGREHVETGHSLRYDSSFWIQVLRDANLCEVYEDLFTFLESHQIEYKVLYSGHRRGTFLESDRVFVHHNLKGRYYRLPSEQKVNKAVQTANFHYQSLLLPRRVQTMPGAYAHLEGGRDASFKRFASLVASSGSVLDVGAAMGELGFLLERLGCEEVVGLEPQRGRYTAACRARKLLRSAVRFKCCELTGFKSKRRFDSVVCLNVIHHVNHYQAFLEKAASMARKYLIIEFPTLADDKFVTVRKGSKDQMEALNNLPLIGMSSLSDADQFYVFSPLAMEKIVLERLDGWRTRDIQKSPIEGRVIAIFERAERAV